MTIEPSFMYRAEIMSVYDGDTVTARVDLGFRVSVVVPLRLFGINAPEMGTEEGQAAKAHLISLLSAGPLTIATFKDPRDKYGRWLAVLSNETYGNINRRMVDDGHAVYYDGSRRLALEAF